MILGIAIKETMIQGVMTLYILIQNIMIQDLNCEPKYDHLDTGPKIR